jgi:uncharacterized protein (DUF1778 family)
MSKTITMRVDDDVYKMIKHAAKGSKRTISNFLEFATIAYLSQETYVSDEEMNEILNDKKLLKTLSNAEKEISKGKYKIV